MKLCLSVLLVGSPLFASAPPCASLMTGGGVTVTPNVTYDNNRPSGQTNAGNTAFIAAPAGMANNAQPDITVMVLGSAWTGQTTDACTQYSTQAEHFVTDLNRSVWAPYLTLATGGTVALAHNPGDKSIVVEAISGYTNNFPWPNTSGTGCIDGTCVMGLPIMALYGVPGVDQETISITSQSGGGLTNALAVGLANTHGANEPIYLPKTEWPAQVGDLASFLNWVASNAGVNYPGNPQRIHLWCGSSGTLACADLVLANNPNLCKTSCLPFVNFNGLDLSGSANPVTPYTIVDVFLASATLSIPWMWDQGYIGGVPGVDKIAIQQLLGAIIDTDTGARPAAVAMSPNTLTGSTTSRVRIMASTGSSDTATGCALANTGTPFLSCAPGNMYDASGLPYVFWLGTAGQHGGDCGSIPGVCWDATVAFEVNSSPVISQAGTVNAASYVAPVTPGSIAAVFGSNLSLGPIGQASSTAASFALPTILAQSSFVIGGRAAPLFFATAIQVNMQIPWELTGQSQAAVVATVDGVASNTETAPVATFAPGIFSIGASGAGQGAILIATTAQLAAPGNAVPRGGYVSIFCTGLGPVTNQPATGVAAGFSPLSRTLTLPTVTIGGVGALVSFSGLAPTLVGVYQVNALVPPDVLPGNAVPVVISVGSAASNTVTIGVR